MVEKWNTHSGTVKQRWWNSGIVIVEPCGGKLEQCWLNSETVMVKPWNRDSGTGWWKSGTVWWSSFGGTVEQ